MNGPTFACFVVCFLGLFTGAFSQDCDPLAVYLGFQSQGGMGVPDVNAMDDCASLCMENNDCVAIDFNIRDPPYMGMRCWLHIGQLGGPRTPNQFVNQFEKNPCAFQA